MDKQKTLRYSVIGVLAGFLSLFSVGQAIGQDTETSTPAETVVAKEPQRQNNAEQIHLDQNRSQQNKLKLSAIPMEKKNTKPVPQCCKRQNQAVPSTNQINPKSKQELFKVGNTKVYVEIVNEPTQTINIDDY